MNGKRVHIWNVETLWKKNSAYRLLEQWTAQNKRIKWNHQVCNMFDIVVGDFPQLLNDIPTFSRISKELRFAAGSGANLKLHPELD